MGRGEALLETLARKRDAKLQPSDPAATPQPRHANTVLDRVTPQRSDVVGEISRYGDNDLVCYRADWPADLAEQQARAWDPLIDWARRRYDVNLCTVQGIMHRPQGEDALKRLHQAVEALQDWQLAPLHTITTITGSLVIALALLEGEVTPEAAFSAGQLDELYQVEKWGEDSLAQKARETRRVELIAAARFLELLRAG